MTHKEWDRAAISQKEYEKRQWAQWRRETLEYFKNRTKEEFERTHPVQTSRDRYGMKGAKVGTYMKRMDEKETGS